MMLNRNLAVFAALNGAMAVAVGAFAAHGAGPGIKTLLTTGAHYQIIHAVLALVCALWGARLAIISGWLAAIDPIAFLPHNVVNVDLPPEYPMTVEIIAHDNADPKTGLGYGNHIRDAGLVLKFADEARVHSATG